MLKIAWDFSKIGLMCFGQQVNNHIYLCEKIQEAI